MVIELLFQQKPNQKKDAVEFLRKFNPDDNRVIHKEQHILLSSFKNEYLEYALKSKSKHYIRSITLSFNQLISAVGDINLQELSVRLLENFILSKFSKSPNAAVLYYRTLKAAFSKAVSWEYLEENPLKKIKAPKVAKTYPVFISKIEFQKILDKTKEQYLIDIFSTAFYTGMRLGELLHMKWNWIDLKNNLIKVQCSEAFTTKSKKERLIPISQNIKSIFANRLPKILNINIQDYVFTRIQGIKLNENFISKKFKQSVRLASLSEKIHFHTLRHSFAPVLVQRGISLYAVKELLGHGNIKTTQIYSHLQKDNLMEAVNIL